MNVGCKVKILNLKEERNGVIVNKFIHGSLEYFRVIYQNMSGDTFMMTTISKNLELI